MRQNNGVVRCNSVVVVIHKVINELWMVLKVWMVLGIELWIGGKMRKRSCELYPIKNADFMIQF